MKRLGQRGNDTQLWVCRVVKAKSDAMKTILHGNLENRSMDQSKLDMIKKVDILGISELKWTGMGKFNSDDHDIYYCGQEMTLMLGRIEGRRRRGYRGPPTQWMWVWANPRKSWRTGKSGMLLSIGSQRVGHNLLTKQQRTTILISLEFLFLYIYKCQKWYCFLTRI